MRVLLRGAQYNGKARFDTWLFTIARNLVIDLSRKRTDGLARRDERSRRRRTPLRGRHRRPLAARAVRHPRRPRRSRRSPAPARAQLSRGPHPSLPRRDVTRGDRHRHPRSRSRPSSPVSTAGSPRSSRRSNSCAVHPRGRRSPRDEAKRTTPREILRLPAPEGSLHRAFNAAASASPGQPHPSRRPRARQDPFSSAAAARPAASGFRSPSALSA